MGFAKFLHALTISIYCKQVNFNAFGLVNLGLFLKLILQLIRQRATRKFQLKISWEVEKAISHKALISN